MSMKENPSKCSPTTWAMGNALCFRHQLMSLQFIAGILLEFPRTPATYQVGDWLKSSEGEVTF